MSNLYTLTYFYADLSIYSTNKVAWWNSGAAYWNYAKFLNQNKFYVVGKAVQINNANLPNEYYSKNVGMIMTSDQSECRFKLTDTMHKYGYSG